MADINKMNRTWLCSVVFMDIVNYSKQSVELQMKWKDRFNGYLASAIKDVPEDERVILDTGDGAATCFLGAPEAAMFTALELWHSLLLDERDQQPQLRVRIGINLGPVKLVRDINGAPNALGDGMNAGQRVMSFAGENQILVSQSYFEVVSRLSDDYKTLFTLKGVETDKHIREHTVYHLSPPGAQHAPVSVIPPGQSVPVPAAAQPVSSKPAASPVKAPQAAPANPPANKAPGNRSIPILIGVIVLLLVAAGAAWRFVGPGAAAKESGQVNATTPAVAYSLPAPAPTPPPAPAPSAPAPAVVSTPADTTASRAPRAKPAVVSTPVARPVEEPPAPPPPRRPGEPPFEISPPVLREVPPADRDTARELRERYANDASRAAQAWRNAQEIRRNLAAKGMSLNGQTAAAVDRLGLLLDEAAEAMRDHKWDDALSSLQGVEATTQKVSSTVGN